MKKKIAVIGFGGMGSWHVNHAQKSDVIELAGIYDIDEAKCEKARSMGIYAYSSLDEVINDKSVELVTIAIPNDVHLETVVRCLKGGKHVICEKPVALSSSDLEEMISASSESGKLFTVHQNRRFDVDYLAMQKIADSGEIGKPIRIESRIHGSRGIPSDWRGEKEHGGGMILDWGIHLIDQILGIIDDKKLLSVYCTCEHITNKQVDDGFKLDMYFEDDVVARVEVGTNHFISIGRFFMVGTAGSAVIKDWHDDCHEIICTEWKEDNVTPVVTAAGLTKTMAPRDAKTTEERTIPRYTSDVHDFYRNLVKAIDGEEEQLITHDQLRRSMMIMEAAFESDKLGRPVEVEDIPAPRKN